MNFSANSVMAFQRHSNLTLSSYTLLVCNDSHIVFDEFRNSVQFSSCSS